MYPVAFWLFHKPSERRRQIYSLIGHLVCLPARYRAWERKIVLTALLGRERRFTFEPFSREPSRNRRFERMRTLP